MNNTRRIKVLGALCVWLLVVTPAVMTQTVTSGTIRGTVSDPSGAVVPAAEVTVTSEETGLARTTTTNEAGVYVFPQLPRGLYRVRVSREGFKEAVQTGIELSVAATVVVNVRIEVGEVVEEVIVEASPVVVETQSGAVSNLIQGTQVRELPLNGRNFVQLTQLMPGVSTGHAFNPSNKGLHASVDMSISGGSSNANIWTVDGANNNDVGSNRTILIYPSLDAIEEFRIHRNNYGPEFGQSGGGQINIVTRSGKNDFHGSVYYFGRNDKLNSTNYFLNLAGADKQTLRRNDWGYTIGGPIVRDRAFFFWSQEWNRERRGTVRSSIVPTAAEKIGDFSAPVLSNCNLAPWDPLADAPFPGGIIPPARLSPAGLLYLQLLPDPNLDPAAAGDPCGINWVGAIVTPINWREELIRGDFAITKSTNLMVRYTQDSWDNNSPNGGEQFGLWGDDAFPAVDSDWDQPAKMFVIKLSNTIGATAVNDFQFSYSNNRIFITRGAGEQLNSAINAAMPPFFSEGGKTGGADRAHLTHWGGPGLPALWHIAPWDNSHDLYVWKDDFSKVVGSHTFKAGFLASTNSKDELIGGASAFEAGQIWGPSGTGLPAWSWEACGNFGTCNQIADILLVDMTHGFDENRVEPETRMRWQDYEFYFGDTWQIRPGLTLNYGVRWAFLREPYAADDRITSFVPALFDPALGADPCNGLIQPPGTDFCQQEGFLGGTPGPNRALVKNANNLIAPRFGFAWDPTGSGKMVIRGGIGQFFARERLLLDLAGNPPFNANIAGLRTLDSNVDPCLVLGFPCNSQSFGAPTVGRELRPLIPNTWQWNLTVEREFWPNSKFEVAYVGNRGLHLLQRLDPNQVLPGDVNGNGVNDRIDFFRAGAVGDTATQLAVRPFGVFGRNADIGIFGRGADSIYHSLQTNFTSRFGRGSMFQFAYTWSKLISTDPLAGTFNNNSNPVDMTNLELDRGPSIFDRRHVFTANLLYNLPSFENQNAFVHHVLGNWAAGTIVSFSSGQAVTIVSGGPQFSGTGLGGNQRPHRVPGQPCRATSGPKHQWLNPNAFTFDGFQIGSIGNAGRGICTAPGVNNWDIALYKNIPVRERVTVQFRLEFFNAFNHTQFRNFGGPDFFSTGFGAQNICYDNTTDNCVTDLGDPATANSVVSSTPGGGFGIATTALPREIQYAIKIIF